MLGVTDNSFQVELAGALATSWGATSPADAARWTLGQTGDVQKQAAASLVPQWARDDPAGAAAWAAQLPAGDARDKAFSNVASSWVDSDPTATENWLGGLSAGHARDAAIASYATAGSNDANPANVLRQVQTIGDPAKRDDTLVNRPKS